MNIKLVVKHAFKDYAIGDEITDADEIKAARASHPGHVVAVDAATRAAPWIEDEGQEPAPEAKAAPVEPPAKPDDDKTKT